MGWLGACLVGWLVDYLKGRLAGLIWSLVDWMVVGSFVDFVGRLGCWIGLLGIVR